MAYDEKLAERIRKMLAIEKGYSEKKMFGGICFMVNGNMTAGVGEEDIMLRVGKEQYEECLKLAGARPMNFTGQEMRGMIYVEKGSIKSEKKLREWLNRALDFVLELPVK